MSRALAGKTAVVTGGSRGIGRGIVDAFVEAGAKVLTCGRSEVSDLPAGVLWVSVDIASPDGIERLAQSAEAELGRVDILINNAGVQVEKTVVESRDEDWDLVMGVNARAVFEACRRFIPGMASNGGGAIVNLGSISAAHADPSMALYNASKAFVLGLTRSIAVDHGGAGIRCNALCPGWIDTGMAEAAFALAREPQAARADALSRHAAGRLGVPADIAAAALWLASDASAFVTGQTLTVDGGLVAATPLRPSLF